MSLGRTFFEYCTISDVRDQGITTSAATDARVKKLIKTASQKINLFTTQWFYPVKMEAFVSGNNSSMIYVENFIPIVKVDTVEVDSANTVNDNMPGLCNTRTSLDNREFGPIDSSDWQLSEDGRKIELVAESTLPGTQISITGTTLNTHSSSYRVFPKGTRNIKIDGVFGWVHDEKDSSTTTDGFVSSGSTKVVVDDSSGFETDDVVIFEIIEDEVYEYKICTNVDHAVKTLEFEELSFSINDETNVYSYGKVPLLLRDVCAELAAWDTQTVGDILNGETPTQMLFATLEERTDNHRYKNHPKSLEAFNSGFVLGSTGYGKLDRILQEFTPPPFVGLV